MKNPRNTVAKTSILDLIIESKAALSHSEIQHSLDGLCDRVTIYRVLERLISEGKIHKAVSPDGIVKYASCTSCSHQEILHTMHNHAHFNCENCKKITCLENIEPQFKIPSSYLIHDINFTISGICPQCQQNTKC